MPTVEGVDPDTGERTLVSIYVRNGRYVYQRLSPAWRDPSEASPAQLGSRIRFMEAASSTYGQTMDGQLPPAAVAVRRTRSPSLEPRIRVQRELAQSRNRALVPPRLREMAEHFARLECEQATRKRGAGSKLVRPKVGCANDVPPKTPIRRLLEAYGRSTSREVSE